MTQTRTRRFGLSKSKITAFEKCPKRLWLAMHRPELAEQDEGAEARFAATLTMVPQFALLADSLEPEDRHVEFQGLFNLAFPLAPRTTMAVELWTAQNWDPSGTVRQYSADAAISHLLNNNLQIDFGGNFGLNQATPDVQLYAGVSARF